MKKVLLTNKAKDDIIAIKNFIAKDNVQASKSLKNILKKYFEMLAEFPNVGVQKKEIIDKSILIYTIKKRYTIAYRLNGDSIEILRILYKYQNIFAIL